MANKHLEKAFNELNINEIQIILDWVLDRKKCCYEAMEGNVDFDNEFIILNPLEDKLRIIYANLIQNRDSATIDKENNLTKLEDKK